MHVDHIQEIARLRSIAFLVGEARRIAEDGTSVSVTRGLDAVLRQTAVVLATLDTRVSPDV